MCIYNAIGGRQIDATDAMEMIRRMHKMVKIGGPVISRTYRTVPTQTKPPLSLNKHPVPYFRRISTVMLCGPDAVEKLVDEFLLVKCHGEMA
jgi:hypothetical protein